MKVVTLARKPMGSTAAECAMEWGTGPLNIDASRVAYEAGGTAASNPLFRLQHGYKVGGGAGFQDRKAKTDGSGYLMPVGGIQRPPHPQGRWPTNVIFQHQRECEIVGEREVKTGVAVRENSGGKTIFSETEKPPMENMTYGDGGKEAIPDWCCAEDCPVADLDRQSGVTTSKGHVRNNAGSWKVRKKGNTTASVETPHTDTGGASRFYRQVKP